MIEKIRSSVKQTIYYGIGNVAIKLVGLLLLPIFSRTFSIELYGLLALLEISAEIIMAVSACGIESGFNRWYWDKEHVHKQKSLFFTTLSFSIISALFWLIISYLIIQRFSVPIYDTVIGHGLMWAFLINILFRIIVSRSLLLLQIQQLVIKQTKLVLLNMAIVLSTTIVFIIVFKMSLDGVFWGQIIGNFVVIISILPFIRKNVEIKFEFKLLKELLSYSLPIAVSTVMAIVMTLSDRFILKHYYDLGDVGQYSLAYKISNLIKLFIVRSFIKSYSFKYYYDINNEDNDPFFYKSLTYFTFVAVYSGLFLSIFSGMVIKAFTDNADYYNSYFIVPYLIVGIILFGIRSMLTLPLGKLKKSKTISIIAIGTGLVNVILNLLFIPHYGSIGAAGATGIAQGLALVVCLILNKKYGFASYEVVKYIKAFVIGIGLIYAWMAIPELNIFTQLMINIAIMILYPFLLMAIGFFEKKEIVIIRQTFQKWTDIERVRNIIKNKRQ